MAEVNAAEKEAKAEAAFGAGFGDTPPAPVVKVVDAPTPKPVELVPAAVPPVVVPEKPQYVRLTKQELDLLKTRVGKVDGLESRVAKFEGSMPKAEQIIQQAIEAFRTQTPSGAKITVTPEDFAELGENFEELSGMTMKGLQRVLDRFNVIGTAPSPAPPVDMDAAVEKVLTAREKRALEKAHPTWTDIVGAVDLSAGEKIPQDNPFRKWSEGLSAEEQTELNETKSPAIVQAFIERFLASQKKAPGMPAAKPIDRAAARRAVIEDAVTPRADGNPPPLTPPQTAEDAFATGFKSVKSH